MDKLILIIIFPALLAYEKIWRPIVCKKKIHKHIESIGGGIDTIEKISAREEIYYVYYIVDKERKNSVVTFDLFYNEAWK